MGSGFDNAASTRSPSLFTTRTCSIERVSTRRDGNFIRTGKELVALRRDRGLTQEELAKDLRCTYETISNYERDKTPITPLMSNYLRYYFTYGPFPSDQ